MTFFFSDAQGQLTPKSAAEIPRGGGGGNLIIFVKGMCSWEAYHPPVFI